MRLREPRVARSTRSRSASLPPITQNSASACRLCARPSRHTLEPLARERGADEQEHEPVGRRAELGAQPRPRVRVLPEAVELDPVGQHLDPVRGNSVPALEIAFHRLRGADAVRRGDALEEPLLDAHDHGGLRSEQGVEAAAGDPSLRLDPCEVVLDLGPANGVHGHQVGVVRRGSLDVHEIELRAPARELLRRSPREGRALERVSPAPASVRRRLDRGEAEQRGCRRPAGSRHERGDVLVLGEPFRVPQEEGLDRARAVECSDRPRRSRRRRSDIALAPRRETPVGPHGWPAGPHSG